MAQKKSCPRPAASPSLFWAAGPARRPGSSGASWAPAERAGRNPPGPRRRRLNTGSRSPSAHSTCSATRHSELLAPIWWAPSAHSAHSLGTRRWCAFCFLVGLVVSFPRLGVASCCQRVFGVSFPPLGITHSALGASCFLVGLANGGELPAVRCGAWVIWWLPSREVRAVFGGAELGWWFPKYHGANQSKPNQSINSGEPAPLSVFAKKQTSTDRRGGN